MGLFYNATLPTLPYNHYRLPTLVRSGFAVCRTGLVLGLLLHFFPFGSGSGLDAGLCVLGYALPTRTLHGSDCCGDAACHPPRLTGWITRCAGMDGARPQPGGFGSVRALGCSTLLTPHVNRRAFYARDVLLGCHCAVSLGPTCHHPYQQHCVAAFALPARDTAPPTAPATSVTRCQPPYVAYPVLGRCAVAAVCGARFLPPLYCHVPPPAMLRCGSAGRCDAAPATALPTSTITHRCHVWDGPRCWRDYTLPPPPVTTLQHLPTPPTAPPAAIPNTRHRTPLPTAHRHRTHTYRAFAHTTVYRFLVSFTGRFLTLLAHLFTDAVYVCCGSTPV